MSKLVGRPHGLELWVNSPLKMDEKGLDIVWQLRHLKPDVIICHVPVLGQSAPIFLRGLLAQSAAECFAAMTVLKLLDLGEITYRVDSFAGYSTDMHTGCVLLSGPDYLRLSVLRIESAKRHGIAVPAAKGLLTQAKEPGTQAAAEKATQSLIMEIAGADYHMAAGTLACDDIFSPIQMIIDNELLSFIRTVTKPIDFSVDDFCLDIISEVGPGGTFLDHLSTVRHFREVFWEPGLFSMNTTAKWLSEGKPNLLERAHDILDSLKLSEEPAVSIEVQKELLNIEDKFKKQL